MDFSKSARDYKEDMISAISRIVSIKSVEEPPLENMPFGAGTAKALAETLEIGRELGFKAVNLDNYAGYIEMGQGEELIGIIGHVDVVPEGPGWVHEPYKPVVENDKLYGRGVCDDKGPVIIALYAMKMVSDIMTNINKRVRLVVGANEETRMECMAHYKKVITEPFTMGFTPDAEFPLIFGEKGTYRSRFSAPLSKKGRLVLQSVNGGEAVNVVCPKCIATFTGSAEALDEAKHAFEKFYNENNLSGCIISEDGQVSFILDGVGAHASTPEAGVNSISYMMLFISQICDEPFVKGYNKLISTDYNGRLCSAFCEDEYGMLTMNVGIVETKDDQISATIDIRYPITLDFAPTAAQMEKNFKEQGFDYNQGSIGPSLFVNPDSALIKALYDSYVQVTGDTTHKPITIGGGTYAKCFKNIVAFGPEFPGGSYNIHMADEALPITDMVKAAEIYACAINKMLEI